MKHAGTAIAVTALLADSTRDEVRTKAMALVGGSIALMFALSLIIAPLLASYIGLHGLFALTGAGAGKPLDAEIGARRPKAIETTFAG